MTDDPAEDPVGAAFAAVPRADFLPESARHRAGLDAPVLIGHGQTCSQPRTVEAMLRLLDLRAGQRVLDVGSGSGWTTALLAHLVGASGSVVATEIVPDLVAFGRANLAGQGLPWARIEQADADLPGAPHHAPYDRILVSAAAERVPDTLVAQLAPGGVMVLPAGGTMLRVRRTPEGNETTEHGAYSFVPLL